MLHNRLFFRIIVSITVSTIFADEWEDETGKNEPSLRQTKIFDPP